MKNRRKKSVKKTLGTVGVITAFSLATVQAIRIGTTESLNTALMWICMLTAALFGLKLGTGIVDAVTTIKQAKFNNEP
jgi:hypothetical protein